MSSRRIYECSRCKKDKLEYYEVVNMGNFEEDRWFFPEPVPKRYRLNFFLCNSCFDKIKKVIDKFMKEDLK